MRPLRYLAGLVLTMIAFSGHSMAMGSGPHPNVLYGLPTVPAHSPDNVTVGPIWNMPIFWLTLLVVAIGLLLWALPKTRKE